MKIFFILILISGVFFSCTKKGPVRIIIQGTAPKTTIIIYDASISMEISQKQSMASILKILERKLENEGDVVHFVIAGENTSDIRNLHTCRLTLPEDIKSGKTGNEEIDQIERTNELQYQANIIKAEILKMLKIERTSKKTDLLGALPVISRLPANNKGLVNVIFYSDGLQDNADRNLKTSLDKKNNSEIQAAAMHDIEKIQNKYGQFSLEHIQKIKFIVPRSTNGDSDGSAVLVKQFWESIFFESGCQNVVFTSDIN